MKFTCKPTLNKAFCILYSVEQTPHGNGNLLQFKKSLKTLLFLRRRFTHYVDLTLKYINLTQYCEYYCIVLVLVLIIFDVFYFTY